MMVGAVQFEQKMTDSIMPGDQMPAHNYMIAPAFFGMTWKQQRVGAAVGEPRHHVSTTTSHVRIDLQQWGASEWWWRQVVLHVLPQQLWAVLCMLEYQKYFER